MRKLVSYKKSGGHNSLAFWWKEYNPLKVWANFVLIKLAQYSPSLRLKNSLLRLIGIKIGPGARIAPGVMIDFFNPEMIEIGEGAIIGYGCTILGHEFLIDEYKTGKVEIGKFALIGANSTILAGVKIGSRAKIGAMSLVNSDVPNGATYGGVPAKKIGKKI